MLGKLMKYEIMATARIFLPLYAMILLMAGISRVFFPLSSETFDLPRMITMMVYIFLLAALFIMTLVVTIQRFSKNLLGDEGYLSFTLPVRVWQHIFSKTIVNLMWMFISLIVSMFSIFLLAVNDPLSMRTFSEGCMEIGEAFGRYGGQAWLIFWEGIVCFIVTALSSALEIYAAISVGHLVPKHKLLAGFGAFVGFGVVEQIVVSLFGDFVNRKSLFWAADNFGDTLSDVSGVLLFCIAFSVVFGVLFYFLTSWILKRKLNLE